MMVRQRLTTLLRPLHVRLAPRQWSSDVPPDFLVVGLQKAGTYWLTALLDGHPEITCFPSKPGNREGLTEGHFFDTLALFDTDRARFKSVFARKHGGAFRDLVPWAETATADAVFEAFRKRYSAFVQRQKRKRLVGEKTPEYVFHLDLIDRIFPGIKKVCLVRDPRDRVVSFHFHQLRKRRIQNDRIERREVEEYCRRMEKEHDLLARYEGNLRIFRYEDLSSDFETTGRNVLAFLGVEASAATVAQLRREASFASLSGRAPGDSDQSSHYRTGTVGDWRNHLSLEFADLIKERMTESLTLLARRKSVDVTQYLSVTAPV